MIIKARQCFYCNKIVRLNSREAKNFLAILDHPSGESFFRSHNEFCGRSCLLNYVNSNSSVGAESD
jgi:hypothetical protein